MAREELTARAYAKLAIARAEAEARRLAGSLAAPDATRTYAKKAGDLLRRHRAAHEAGYHELARRELAAALEALARARDALHAEDLHRGRRLEPSAATSARADSYAGDRLKLEAAARRVRTSFPRLSASSIADVLAKPVKLRELKLKQRWTRDAIYRRALLPAQRAARL